MNRRSLAAATAVIALTVAVGGAAVLARGGERAVRIGVLTDCQGPLHGFQEAELSGAELPLLRRGARLYGAAPTAGISAAAVAGRRVELVQGCAEAGEHTVYIEEARWLVEREHVDAVVGGASVVTRDVARLYPDVPFVETLWDDQEITLRHPAPNLYRFTIDDSQQAAGLGTYAYRTLGWRRASIVAGDDAPGWGGAAGFVAEFCSLGGRVIRQVSRIPGATNRSLSAQALAGHPDGVALFLTSFDDPTAFTQELLNGISQPARQLLLWPQQLEDPTFLKVLGPRLDGVTLTSWLPAGPPADALRRHRAAYRRFFPRLPAAFADVSGVIGYSDSVEALLQALERSGGKLSDDRYRFRQELGRLRLVLPRGIVTLDRNRQAVTSVPLVRLRLRGGEVTTEPVSSAANVEQSFGGLLTKAPPPGPSSQQCRRATPPSWARG
jgi:branched-chain amino acid transport system substrate-binding protein